MLTRRVALSSAVLPRVHPPQLKPMTTVPRKPAKAPRARRLSDSPFSIADNSMWFPFARGVSVRGYGHPDGFRPISWIKGPVGLRRRLDQTKYAPIGRPSLYKIDHPAVGDWRGLSPKVLKGGSPTPAGTRFRRRLTEPAVTKPLIIRTLKEIASARSIFSYELDCIVVPIERICLPSHSSMRRKLTSASGRSLRSR